MSDRRDRERAAASFGDPMLEVQATLDALRAELSPPQDPAALVGDIAPLGIGPTSRVVDVGAGRGIWSQRIVEHYGCVCFAIDLSHPRLRDAAASGVPAIVADADVLPFGGDSIDVVWCRDTLEMLANPVAVLREFFRVVGSGGGVALYTPWATELLEPRERAEIIHSLGTDDPWFLRGRAPVDDAIRAAGFDVLHFEHKAPLYSEYLLASDPDTVTSQLLKHSQLRRGRDHIEAAIGEEWYARFLAWTAWQAYLLLGKLETGLWLLRKPD